MRENFAAKNKTKRCDEIAKLERCERKTLVCNSLSETGTFDLKKKDEVESTSQMCNVLSSKSNRIAVTSS